jgi:hypothetical protein
MTLATAAAFCGAMAACSTPAPAPAHHPTNVQSLGSVDQRQRDIDSRIENAFRSGQISASDHRAFRAESDEIRRDEQKYMANGELSPGERTALHARLDRLGRLVDERIAGRGATR